MSHPSPEISQELTQVAEREALASSKVCQRGATSTHHQLPLPPV